MACGRERDDEPPEDGVGGEVFARWETGDEECGWICPSEVAKVEDAAYPAILLALEVLVLSVSDQPRRWGSGLTLSSRSPKTAALERIVLSMKLSMYVTNKSGMMVRSIFLKTRFSRASL